MLENDAHASDWVNVSQVPRARLRPKAEGTGRFWRQVIRFAPISKRLKLRAPEVAR